MVLLDMYYVVQKMNDRFNLVSFQDSSIVRLEADSLSELAGDIRRLEKDSQIVEGGIVTNIPFANSDLRERTALTPEEHAKFWREYSK